MTDTDRAARACAKCGAEDTHTHHVQYVAVNHPVTGDPVDLTVTKHVQCCAADGCPVCQTDVEHAAANNVGADQLDEFTGYMQTKTAAHLQALADRHGIASADIAAPGEN